MNHALKSADFGQGGNRNSAAEVMTTTIQVTGQPVCTVPLRVQGGHAQLPMTVEGLRVYDALLATKVFAPLFGESPGDPYFKAARPNHYNPYLDALIVTIFHRLGNLPHSRNIDVDKSLAVIIDAHFKLRGWEELTGRVPGGYTHERRRLFNGFKAYSRTTGMLIDGDGRKANEPLLTPMDIEGILATACGTSFWYMHLLQDINVLAVLKPAKRRSVHVTNVAEASHDPLHTDFDFMTWQNPT